MLVIGGFGLSLFSAVLFEIFWYMLTTLLINILDLEIMFIEGVLGTMVCFALCAILIFNAFRTADAYFSKNV